jgi:metal-responsive CopG/Arc/MetJ family transcriptional regulator
MIQAPTKKYDTVRTTVSLPVELLQRSQQLIDQGLLPNRNTLIIAALENFLAELERQTIDEKFAAMMDDADYQVLNEAIITEFEESDWEALQEGEAALS